MIHSVLQPFQPRSPRARPSRIHDHSEALACRRSCKARFAQLPAVAPARRPARSTPSRPSRDVSCILGSTGFYIALLTVTLTDPAHLLPYAQVTVIHVLAVHVPAVHVSAVHLLAQVRSHGEAPRLQRAVSWEASSDSDCSPWLRALQLRAARARVGLRGCLNPGCADVRRRSSTTSDRSRPTSRCPAAPRPSSRSVLS